MCLPQVFRFVRLRFPFFIGADFPDELDWDSGLVVRPARANEAQDGGDLIVSQGRAEGGHAGFEALEFSLDLDLAREAVEQQLHEHFGVTGDPVGVERWGDVCPPSNLGQVTAVILEYGLHHSTPPLWSAPALSNT